MSQSWTYPSLLKLYGDWRDGSDIDELAAKYSRTANAIRQQLHLAGVKRSTRKLSEVRRDAVVARWLVDDV